MRLTGACFVRDTKHGPEVQPTHFCCVLKTFNSCSTWSVEGVYTLYWLIGSCGANLCSVLCGLTGERSKAKTRSQLGPQFLQETPASPYLPHSLSAVLLSIIVCLVASCLIILLGNLLFLCAFCYPATHLTSSSCFQIPLF